MPGRFAITYSALDERYPAQMRFLRFLISGGTAAVVDLLFLYVLTDGIHMWYLLSSVLAFLAAFSVSFTLQKRWTFRDRSNDRLHVQAPVYLP